MNIATKVTLVVLFLAGLLLLGSGFTSLLLHERATEEAVAKQGRVLAQTIHIAAEQDLGNHGKLGALVDLVDSKPGQRLIFFDHRGQAIAPVPVDEEPSAHPRILKLLERGAGKEMVVGTGELATYLNRMLLKDPRGAVAGAMELTISVVGSWERGRWLQTSLMVTGVLVVLFALVFGFYAHRAIGRPISLLMDGMDAIIRGDLTHALPLDRNDEIGRIAYQFNEMTGRLRAALDEIKDNAATKLKLEGSLRRSEKLATIGQLSAEIAHEVGTPLNVIGGRARTLKRKAERPQDVVKNAEIIGDQVTRITRIIQQVLDLSRAPTRRTEPTDIRRIIEDAVSFLEVQTNQAAIEVTVEMAESLPLVDADADGVQQVALNLMLNAIHAMPDGGALTLRVTTTHRRKGGLDHAPPQSYLAISVEDTGVGIPEDVKKQVFDPFFTTKAKGQGTGLGLTVVHGIVKEHDGWVEIDNAEPGGTIFRVFLPLPPEDEEGSAEMAPLGEDSHARPAPEESVTGPGLPAEASEQRSDNE